MCVMHEYVVLKMGLSDFDSVLTHALVAQRIHFPLAVRRYGELPVILRFLPT